MKNEEPSTKSPDSNKSLCWQRQAVQLQLWHLISIVEVFKAFGCLWNHRISWLPTIHFKPDLQILEYLNMINVEWSTYISDCQKSAVSVLVKAQGVGQSFHHWHPNLRSIKAKKLAQPSLREALEKRMGWIHSNWKKCIQTIAIDIRIYKSLSMMYSKNMSSKWLKWIKQRKHLNWVSGGISNRLLQTEECWWIKPVWHLRSLLFHSCHNSFI